VRSRDHLKTISISEDNSGALFEGDLGEPVEIVLQEDMLLLVKGTLGTLRVEVTREELKQVLQAKPRSGN
jgi:hypothetical protein